MTLVLFLYYFQFTMRVLFIVIISLRIFSSPVPSISYFSFPLPLIKTMNEVSTLLQPVFSPLSHHPLFLSTKHSQGPLYLNLLPKKGFILTQHENILLTRNLSIENLHRRIICNLFLCMSFSRDRDKAH